MSNLHLPHHSVVLFDGCHDDNHNSQVLDDSLVSLDIRAPIQSPAVDCCCLGIRRSLPGHSGATQRTPAKAEGVLIPDTSCSKRPSLSAQLKRA